MAVAGTRSRIVVVADWAVGAPATNGAVADVGWKAVGVRRNGEKRDCLERSVGRNDGSDENVLMTSE